MRQKTEDTGQKAKDIRLKKQHSSKKKTKNKRQQQEDGSQRHKTEHIRWNTEA